MSASFSSENVRDGGNPYFALRARPLPTHIPLGGQTFLLALLAPRKGIHEKVPRGRALSAIFREAPLATAKSALG